MASTSSLTLSQALLARAISHHHHASNPSSFDRVVLLPTQTIPTFFGLKSLYSKSSTGVHHHRRRVSHSSLQVRASIAQTPIVDKTTDISLVEKSVNSIRFLAIDAIEKANSDHPGLSMGCFLMGHILYDEFMRYNPKNPYWFNHDRFVLLAGHGCMLQYALLHLARERMIGRGYPTVQNKETQDRKWKSDLRMYSYSPNMGHFCTHRKLQPHFTDWDGVLF